MYGSSVISQSRFVNHYAEQRHWLLTADRFKAGLLSPFDCAVCGLTALDPHGRNGKNEHLCDGCAAPIGNEHLMKTTLEGAIREIEERQTRKGKPWFRLTLEVKNSGPYGEETTLIPVNAFSAIADQARRLPRGSTIKVDVRLSGTEYRSGEGRIQRGITATIESLTVIPKEPLVPRRNWHRKAVLRPTSRNEDGDPTNLPF